LHLRVAQQRGVVLVNRGDAELLARLVAFARVHAAGRHQPRPARAQRELLGVALAHAAEADDTDVQHCAI
jgi:hypothetical protein